MKRSTLALAAAALAAPLLASARVPPDSTADRTKAELMQLERDIGAANVRRDAAFFERVEAEEFVFTDSGGGVTTKAEDVAGVKAPPNPDVKLLAYDVDDMQVRLYGDTAVVTGRVTTRQLVKGEERTGKSRFTDVFVRRDGRWQLVAGHSSRMKA
jgi:ketosteroid isomerase-like protein